MLLELTVDPEDLGRVIGKRGATAQSLRTLLRALGTQNDSRYNLKIIDNGDGEHRRESPRQQDKPAVASGEAPAPAPAAQPDEPAVDEDDTSDVVSKTRKELAEFDDLDL